MVGKMHTLFGVLITCTSLLNVSGQVYNWDCNHYGQIPTDVCIGWGTSSSIIFECNGTDSLNQLIYFGNDTCSGTSPYVSVETNTSLFQCDQSATCDYMTIDFYEDTDCDEYYFSTTIVTGHCIGDSGDDTSLTYECTTDGNVLYTIYLNDNSCSGSFIEQIVSPDEIFGYPCTVISECSNEVTAEPVSTVAIENGNIGPFDCNLALFQLGFPLLENECSYVQQNDNNEDSITSYLVECANDGESAMIYEYNNNDCSGDIVNETNATYYYCGASSNGCGTTTMTFNSYNDTIECDTESNSNGKLTLAYVSGCYNYYQGLYYVGIDVTDNSVDIGFYLGDNECGEDSKFTGFTFDEGCNENFTSGSSIDVSFTSTGGSGGGGSDGAVIITVGNKHIFTSLVLFVVIFINLVA